MRKHPLTCPAGQDFPSLPGRIQVVWNKEPEKGRQHGITGSDLWFGEPEEIVSFDAKSHPEVEEKEKD